MPPRKKTGESPSPDTITDPVDWAQHYWRQQNFEGDERRFLAMGSLLRYQRIVFEVVENELRHHNLNLTDYLMLMTLQLSKSGTRLISSLARNLLVHPTTATLAIDRLEAKHLLFRSPHPTDRRATCVTISGAGRELVHRVTIDLGNVEFGFVGASETQLKKLTDVLASLRSSAGDIDAPSSRAAARTGT
jgi:DNA-binding MarR family transcriptional regulator